MIFSTLSFLYFFIIYSIIWFLFSKKYRISIIIIFSLFFYGYWNWNYTLLPVILTLLTFFSTIYFMSDEKRRNKKNLTISIIFIISPLIFFKYFNFLFNTDFVNLPLPLGISFITFTLIAYIVDVYKKITPCENSFSMLFAYIMYFPQLIAGPILRPHELIPQLKKIAKVDSKIKIFAIVIFSIGLIKKVVFADQLSPYVDAVYINPLDSTLVQSIVAFYSFPVQLYCDFSGYSDMAIGLALFFGIKLPINFNKPYLSTSIPEFWRGWHISLSSWIRDYAYFPLGNVIKNIYFRSLIVMTLVGLWHGASWNMVIFGFIHGMLVSISNFIRIRKIKNPISKKLKVFITFHIFSLTLLFFRGTSFQNTIDMIISISSIDSFIFNDIKLFIYPIILIILFFIFHRFDSLNDIKKLFDKLKTLYISIFLVFIWVLVIVINISNNGSDKFIYFDF